MDTFLRNSKIFTVVFFIANMFLANVAFGQTVPSVATDLLDYPPGATAIITGSGFQAGETVTLLVEHVGDDPLGTDEEYHQPWDVVADDYGNFETSWYVPTDGDALGATFLLTADGQSSERHAEWMFTDGLKTDTYPSLFGFFTGASSFCKDVTATAIGVSWSTTTCNGNTNGSNTNIGITIKWYSNTSNSTSGGIEVQSTTIPSGSGSATTSSSYTPSTAIIGDLYYYVTISWSAGNNCATVGSITTSATKKVTIISLPTLFDVTHTGSLCGTVTINLSGSETDVNYQLKRGGTNEGSPVPGTGSSLSFGNFSSTGTYTVVATNTSTTCSSTMNGSVVLTGGSPPTVYNVTGGGTFCIGGAGVPVGVDNSQNNVNYQLYRDATPVGSPVAGSNGNAISFGNQTVAGTYTVIATNNSGCTSEMTGSVDVTIYAVFTSGAINTTGETICYGGDPALIGSATAASGGDGSIVYEWRADGTPIASSNSATYDPPSGLTATTVYTRYAKDGTCNTTFTVSTGSWTVTVRPAFTSGAINTTGETICYGGDPALIGSATAASGGDQTITYKWQFSLLGDFTDAIDIGSSDAATYDPPAGLTTTRTYRRLAHDATCNTDFEISTGEWMVTINPLPTLSTAAQEEALCPGNGAVINLTGLLPSTTNSITYNIDGGSDYTATGVVADGSGNGSFTTINLNYEDHYGKTLTITSITITSNNPNCSQSFTEEVVLDILVPTIISSITPTKTSWTYGCESATITVAADGEGSLTYEWKHKYLGVTTTVGTDSDSYTVPELAGAGIHEYLVIVSAECGTATSSTVTITITPQEADAVNDGEAYYTGPSIAFTANPTSSTSTFTLSAFVQNSDDVNCGDIATARISFSYRVAGGGAWTKVPNGQNQPVNYVDPANPSKGGTAAVIAQLNIGSGTCELYDILVTISGNYIGSEVEALSQISITKPQPGGTISGGAKLSNTSSTGSSTGFVKGTGAYRSELGFFVNYALKAGKAQNPKGKVNLKVKSYYDRFGNLTSDVHHYKITSNAIASMAITGAKATFTSKANIVEIINCETGETSAIEGNCTMVLELEDKSCGNNQQDLLGIVIYRNSGGIWYSNNYTSKGITAPTTIYCGDVYVSGSGITCGTTSLTAKTTTNAASSSKIAIVETQAEEITEQATVFNVMVYPNPSVDQFTVAVEGSSTENVQVAVFDVLGRLLKAIEKKDGEVIQFGEDLPTGSYIAKISQGVESKTVQLIKK